VLSVPCATAGQPRSPLASVTHEVLALDRLIRDLRQRTASKLIERPVIGIHSAAQLLITPGANPERLRHSGAAFAALCGASPVQASMVQTQPNRLSRGGNRTANNALWTIANNRMIPQTRTASSPKSDDNKATAERTPAGPQRYIAHENLRAHQSRLALRAVLADTAWHEASTPSSSHSGAARGPNCSIESDGTPTSNWPTRSSITSESSTAVNAATPPLACLPHRVRTAPPVRTTRSRRLIPETRLHGTGAISRCPPTGDNPLLNNNPGDRQ